MKIREQLISEEERIINTSKLIIRYAEIHEIHKSSLPCALSKNLGFFFFFGGRAGLMAVLCLSLESLGLFSKRLLNNLFSSCTFTIGIDNNTRAQEHNSLQ